MGEMQRDDKQEGVPNPAIGLQSRKKRGEKKNRMKDLFSAMNVIGWKKAVNKKCNSS